MNMASRAFQWHLSEDPAPGEGRHHDHGPSRLYVHHLLEGPALQAWMVARESRLRRTVDVSERILGPVQGSDLEEMAHAAGRSPIGSTRTVDLSKRILGPAQG